MCSILNILLPELQPNQSIFKSFEKFIESLNLENWVILYIFFELNLIKNLGYDPNLSKFKNDVTNVDEIKKIKIESFYYEVPEYLISKKIPDKASNYLIKKSLYFTRHIIQNRFFIPNNLTFPKSRILFENYFN